MSKQVLFKISSCLWLALALLEQGSVFGQTSTNESPLRLVWQDEFSGDSLDYTRWGVEENAFGGGNKELQLYTDRAENVRVENGSRVIEARRDKAQIASTSREYSSGQVRTKHQIQWFVDDQLYQTQTAWNSTGGKFPAPFDQAFHLVLNVAVGGEFLGPPDQSTMFPQTMLVDYVRVYQ